MLRCTLLVWIPFLVACHSVTARSGVTVSSRVAWVELGPEGRAVARVITKAPECPSLMIDGKATPMKVRAERSEAYPVLVCEARVPSRAQSIGIGGTRLPLAPLTPNRVVVFGDTGCRINAGTAQSCNDSSAWPFPRVVAAVRRLDPDLVIHVGDYVYRETACPSGDSGCEGSPHGENWATWAADFFAPAQDLLGAVPWVFTRGNHESCDRWGKGWFRFLDPGPYTEKCSDFTDPYWILLNGLSLYELDSSSAEDVTPKPGMVERFRAAFKTMSAFPARSPWLVTHRPIWASYGGVVINSTLQQASKGLLPAGLSLVLAGHLHEFQSLGFADAGPAEIVAGIGGTRLDQAPPARPPLRLGDRLWNRGTSFDRHGFLLLERKREGWLATVYDVDGREMTRFPLSSILPAG